MVAERSDYEHPSSKASIQKQHRKELGATMTTMPFVYYLNIDAHQERNTWMRTHLSSLGFQFERIRGDVFTEGLGFRNAGVRGNALSHTEAIKRSIDKPCCIMEDDAKIVDINGMLYAIESIKEEEWDVLYFHGGSTKNPEQIKGGVLDTTAYMVNQSSALVLYEIAKSFYDDKLVNGDKGESTFFDQYLASCIQSRLRFFGVLKCIVQDRERFGYTLGW